MKVSKLLFAVLLTGACATTPKSELAMQRHTNAGEYDEAERVYKDAARNRKATFRMRQMHRQIEEKRRQEALKARQERIRAEQEAEIKAHEKRMAETERQREVVLASKEKEQATEEASASALGDATLVGAVARGVAEDVSLVTAASTVNAREKCSDLGTMSDEWSVLRTVKYDHDRLPEIRRAVDKLEECRQEIVTSRETVDIFCQANSEATSNVGELLDRGLASEGFTSKTRVSGKCGSVISVKGDFDSKPQMRALIQGTGIERLWVRKVKVSNGAETVRFSFDQLPLKQAARAWIEDEFGVWKLPK